MGRRPQPWFRKSRQSWFICLYGVQYNLGPDKNEAYERFYKLLASKPKPLQRQRVSPEALVAICDNFLDWTQKHRSAATYEWYRCRLQDFISRHKQLMVCELKPYHVQEWADENPNHSETTRRNDMRAMKRCLRWAVKQGYLDHNPIAHMEMPAAQTRTTVLTADQFAELLSQVEDQSFRDLLQITWETGCRPQESQRVESRHVELPLCRWVLPPAEAKGKSMPRIVYLTETALEITQRLTQQYPEGPLFRNSRGRPWHKYAVSNAFARLQVKIGKRILDEQLQQATAAELQEIEDKITRISRTLKPTCTIKGVTRKKTPAELRYQAKRKFYNQLCRQLAPGYSLYALRHSWATNALRNGLDSLTVAILMGHKDPSTLARVYQHLSHHPDHLLAQARRGAT